jgi:hypothetical protein
MTKKESYNLAIKLEVNFHLRVASMSKVQKREKHMKA